MTAVLGILVVAALPLLVFGDALEQRLESAADPHWLRAQGPAAAVFAVGLLVADVVLPVPASAVMAALGMVYGPWLGGVIGGVGSVLGGLVAYWSCRLAGERAAILLLGPPNLTRLRRFFARTGLVAIALSRWLPLVPEALACLAGLSRMRAWPFTAALAAGSFAMSWSFAALGEAWADQPAAGLAFSALGPFAAWPLLRRWLRADDAAGPNGGCDPAGEES